MHETLADSTTPTYLDNSVGDHEQDSDAMISPNKFDSIHLSHTYPYQFPNNALYAGYSSDPSTMMYNPAYNYIGSTSGPMPSTAASTSMPFNPYGRYPSSVYYSNNYNPAFF
jgi:hypothetical protein